MKKVLSLIAIVVLFGLSGCVEPTVEEEPNAVHNGERGESPVEESPVAEPTSSSNEDQDSVENSLNEAPDLVVHEWGTYTSLQGSDGAQVEGLHLTEELLPDFVHVRSLGTEVMKSMEQIPEGVTQKLETPVIYFYGKQGYDVSVEVDFPQGVISEWYPSSTDFTPGVANLEHMAGGMMHWDVQVRPEHTLDAMFPVSDQSVWAPSRQVASDPVLVGDEQEKFIFYRGLGRFEMPFEVRHDSDGLLHISNRSDDDIPAAFLLKVHPGGGAVVPLGAIPAQGEATAQPGPKEIDIDRYVLDASTQLEEALMASGLFQDEARAMVNTWEKSYFRTQGLRVLYIAPRRWTDDLLPMRIAPEPDRLVRTLVGRVEVMTRDAEQELLQEVQTAQVEGAIPPSLADYGRFAIPRLERIKALSEDDSVDAYCQSLIEQIEVQAVLDGE